MQPYPNPSPLYLPELSWCSRLCSSAASPALPHALLLRQHLNCPRRWRRRSSNHVMNDDGWRGTRVAFW
eukprot:7387456-Prymnesium_polylepis.1